MAPAPTHIVAIDGPSGTGKSTVARGLAARLGWQLLDTGAMYRAVALMALRTGIDLDHESELEALARRVNFEQLGGEFRINGETVTDQLRSPEISQAASRVAVLPRVRAVLADWQRTIGALRPTVEEGRDQGTEVFPGAVCKYFLTASVASRARRRWIELTERGVAVDFEATLAEQEERDRRDRDRAVAPLRPAPDAILVDTTNLAAEKVIDVLEACTRARLEDRSDETAPNRSLQDVWIARSASGELIGLAGTRDDLQACLNAHNLSIGAADSPIRTAFLTSA